MKKATIIMTILFVLVSGKSLSQDLKEQTRTQIKPALLIIDIQNVYLGMVPERGKEVAMHFISLRIECCRVCSGNLDWCKKP